MAISIGRLSGSDRSDGNRGTDDRGDQHSDAFEAFFQEFRPRVAGYVRRHIHDYELIDDIVQETLLRAYRYGLHHQESDEPWRWLATVARNLCIDQRALHRNWRERSLDGDATSVDLTMPESADPEFRAMASDARGRVSRVLAELGPRERRLLVQRHFEGRGVREMAEIEGLHVEAIKSALRRARRAFHETYTAAAGGHGLPAIVAPIAAAVGLRLREIKARIGATGDQVTALAAHATTSAGVANTLTAAAVVVGLAFGPGLGSLLPERGAGGPESEQSQPVTLGGSGARRPPTLAAASQRSDAPLVRDRVPVASAGRDTESGQAPGSGSQPGGDQPAPPHGDLGPDVPDGNELGGSKPEPEPVDVGEDEVEEPEDAWFEDFAYASEKGEAAGQPNDGDSSPSDPSGSDSESSSEPEVSEQERPVGGSDDGGEPADPADPADPASVSDDSKESDEGTGETDGGDDQAVSSAQEDPDRAVGEIFALGQPKLEKRGDCNVQCAVLFHSTDGGASWTKLRAKGLEANEIFVSPRYPDDPRIFAVGHAGLMISEDRGDTFWPVLPASTTRASAAFWPSDRGGEDRIVFGTEGGAWVLHLDSGVVRRLPTGPMIVTAVAPIVLEDGSGAVLVGGVVPGARTGTDERGRVGSKIEGVVVRCGEVLCEPWGTLPDTPFYRVTNPEFIEVVYTGDGPAVFALWMGSLVRSGGEGEPFTSVDPSSDPNHAAVLQSEVYLVSTDVQRTTEGYEWRTLVHVSRDGGLSWAMSANPEDRVGKLATLPGGRLIGADQRNGGVLCSDDGGARWQPRCVRR